MEEIQVQNTLNNFLKTQNTLFGRKERKHKDCYKELSLFKKV